MKGDGKQFVRVCAEQDKVADHLDSPFRLCLGKALTVPMIKDIHSYRLLPGCSLLMVVSGQGIPAISSCNIWAVLLKKPEAGNS